MTCVSTRTGGNTSANLETAGCRSLTRTTSCWRYWAGLERRQESSAIRGASRWIRTGIFTSATLEIIECKSLFADEFSVHASAISLVGGAGAGMGDLAVSEERCADQFMATLGRVDFARCGADGADFGIRRFAVEAPARGGECFLRAGPFGQHSIAATGGC